MLSHNINFIFLNACIQGNLYDLQLGWVGTAI